MIADAYCKRCGANPCVCHDFDELIAKSSIGVGLRDIEKRGIGAHLADLEQEMAPKKRCKASTSPTARSLAECRKRGWVAQVVERWNPHARVRQDLFGVIDIVAIVPSAESDPTPRALEGSAPAIIGIQATINRSGEHAAHRAKILAEPRAKAWVIAGGRLELWTWAKQGARGKQKRWTLRIEVFSAGDWGIE